MWYKMSRVGACDPSGMSKVKEPLPRVRLNPSGFSGVGTFDSLQPCSTERLSKKRNAARIGEVMVSKVRGFVELGSAQELAR